jgi:hypothetical protein
LVDLPKPAADIVMLSLPASVVVSGLVGIDWTVCSVELVVMTTVVGGQPEHIVSAGPGFHGGIVLIWGFDGRNYSFACSLGSWNP